jgi:hypothetical protein
MWKETRDGVVVYVTTTQRGHSKSSWTHQGEKIPLDASRVGVKAWNKAGSGGGKSRGLHGGNGGVERREKIANLKAKELLND